MYRDKIVTKPWGYEYLIYENSDVAVWCLYINKNQQTSMHCHPKKTTGLIVLDGEIEVSFLADSRKLISPNKVMIRRGLFHSTKSLSECSILFEIETPKDKHDLVRLNDVYGREKSTYEGTQFELPKNDNHLWIEEPATNKSIEYELGGCNITVETINDISILNKKKNSDIIVFLKGGMIRNVGDVTHNVTMAGDVGYGSIIKQVSVQLDGVEPNTIIMTIRKNEQ